MTPKKWGQIWGHFENLLIKLIYNFILIKTLWKIHKKNLNLHST